MKEKTGNKIMENSMNVRLKKITLQEKNLITCVLVFLFMLYLNISVRYCTDDWHYEFVYYNFMPDAGVRKMRTFQDVFISIQNYYEINGGRILANGMIFCVLMAAPWVFDLINTIMFVILGLLVYFLVPDRGWRQHTFSLPLIYISVMYFSLSFGDSTLWLSGAVNYLWTAVLNLAAVFLFQKYTKKSVCRLPHCLLLAFIMFLAGQSNETTGGMLLILLALHGLFHWQEKKIQWRLYAAAVPAILGGMAIVLLAPGNWNRAKELHHMETIGFSEIRYSVCTYMIDLMRQSWPILLLCLFIFFLQAKKEGWLKACYVQRFFWAGSIGMAALGMAGVVEARGTFLPMVYLILAGCNSTEYFLKQYKSMTREERRSAVSEKNGLNTVIFCVVAAQFSMNLIYLFCVVFRTRETFSLFDFFFLMRGVAIMILAAAFPALPTKMFWLEKMQQCGEKILKICVTFMVIWYLVINVIPFQENNAKMRWTEEQARKVVSAEEGDLSSIRWPVYSDSDLWPVESGRSIQYTKEWMIEYFQEMHQSGS